MTSTPTSQDAEVKHLMTPDLTPACGASGSVLLVPPSIASQVDCPRCVEWIRA